MSYSVFISYATQNLREAEEIREALEAHGIYCWIAPRNVSSGAEYTTEIMRGIHASQVVVAVLSSFANQSKWVPREIERAIHLGKLLIPFRVEPILPKDGLELMLSVPQWLDAFPPPRERKLVHLVNDVRQYLAGESLGAQPLSKSGATVIQPVPVLDSPQIISEHWPSIVAVPHARETILEIADRMVRCIPPTVNLNSLTSVARSVVPTLETTGVVRLQPGRFRHDGPYVVFCNCWLVRQALADWVEFRGISQPQELPEIVNGFTPLADGVALFLHGQPIDRVRELLKSWITAEGLGISRLVGRVIADLVNRQDARDDAVRLVLLEGSFSAVKGLALAAKQWMEQRQLVLSCQTYASVLQWCQEKPPNGELRRFQVEIANEQGRLMRRLGQLQQAAQHFRRTLQCAENLGDPALTGTVANNLAGALLDFHPTDAGLPFEVIDILEHNVERLTECGQLRQLAVAYHLLARVYSTRDPARAQTYHERDIDACRRQEDLAALADALDSCGVFLAEQGSLADAERVHAEEVQLFERIADPQRHARALANLGSVLFRQSLQGNAVALERARSTLEKSRTMFAGIDAPQEIATTIENLARCYQQLQALGPARRLLKECIEHYNRYPAGITIAREIQEELDQWPEDNSPFRLG